MNQAATILRAVKGAIRANGYAWPGGYPLYVITDDGDTLSIAAARQEWAQICRSTIGRLIDGWGVMGVDINWEDVDMVCCHTGQSIECAYPADDDGEG